MAQSTDTDRGRSIVVRWRILAARRLEYLVQLYESGRWKVYHKEPDFIEMVQEARAALRAWEVLAPPDPIHDKSSEIAIAQMDDDDIPDLIVSSANSVAAEHDLRKS